MKKFKCDECGFESYRLKELVVYNSVSEPPVEVDFDDDAEGIFYFVARCEGCWKRWGNNDSMLDLQELMITDGVLK
jgi:hypothetical protein